TRRGPVVPRLGFIAPDQYVLLERLEGKVQSLLPQRRQIADQAGNPLGGHRGGDTSKSDCDPHDLYASQVAIGTEVIEGDLDEATVQMPTNPRSLAAVREVQTP